MFLYVYDKTVVDELEKTGIKLVLINQSNKDFTIYGCPDSANFNFSQYSDKIKISNKLLF